MLGALSAAPLAFAGQADTVVDAARIHDVPAVRALLARGIDATTAQADGTTALHWAAQWGDEGLADALLSAGASAKAVNRYGASVLSVACESGSTAVVARLLASGADPNGAPVVSGE